MFDAFGFEIWLLLFAVASLAGCIDVIAGGGGLLVLPTLLSVGLSPAQALATNKLQASFGTSTAVIHFSRKGQVTIKSLLFAIGCTFIGAAIGTVVVQLIDNTILTQLIPVLLIGIAIYMLINPTINTHQQQQKITEKTFALFIGFGIGFYDGFFGPGTGTFFTIAYITLMGYSLTQATIHSKVLNWASNIASLLFFILGGQVVWAVGLVMAAGQVVGAYCGSHLVLKQGSKIIRPLLVIICVVMSVKLLMD
ncbi:TSUP family transporter [Spartinivicinus poritis]|uniref:Probable membrane transporter protein n=1 Tax=Spartinivicinus poritis TaxID=2994640 RepID=A0ABT5UGN6_9GAMM|nr:TSUP family transporter [Spartinivicinus sp. A2-2]MDE1465544.1 TSUP family transporter [Spartinivicinus sp. A2-2]